MKQLSRLLVVALVAISAIACAGKVPPIFTPPASIVTPEGKTAYTVDQIVKRVNELENTTAAGNNDHSIPDDIAIPIVRFCINFDFAARKTPEGFKPTLIAGWAELKVQLKDKTLPPSLKLVFGAVDGIVASLTPPPTAAPSGAK